MLISPTLPALSGIEALRARLPHPLASQLRRASELVTLAQQIGPKLVVPTTVAPLDRILGGGLARGSLVELVGHRSGGRFAIVIAAIAAATSAGEAAALVDLGDGLDPRAAEEAGVDFTRLLWVRPRRLRDALLAAEMLVATGFPLVVCDLGVPPVRGRVPASAWLRLGRAAERHETALFVSTPYRSTGPVAQAVVLLERGHAEWRGEMFSPQLLTGLTGRLIVQKRRGESGPLTGLSSFAASSLWRCHSCGALAPPPPPSTHSRRAQKDQWQKGGKEDEEERNAVSSTVSAAGK